MRVRIAFAAATLLVTVPAFAQHEPAPEDPPRKDPKIVYRPNETHDFDGLKIIGERRAPAGIFMQGREGEKFPTIIEERVHFKRDLAKSLGITVTSQKSETEAK